MSDHIRRSKNTKARNVSGLQQRGDDMETVSLELKQFSLNVGIEVAPLLQTMYKDPTMMVQSYGMNTQEGGQMCQVLAEHAQTLGTTHRGGQS